MKKHIPYFVAIVCVILLVMQRASFRDDRDGAMQAVPKKESVYDRIMQTRTIKCGYFVWAPYLVKDSNTRKLSGIYVDYMDAISKITDLKVEWTQELNFGTYIQDIENGRYDMECAGGWQNAQRGQHVFYPHPYAFVPYVALVRIDDKRFDKSPDDINREDVRVATIEGELSSMFRQLRFPKTKNVGLPPISTFSDVFVNVTTGKADVAFSDIISAKLAVRQNPDKAKIIRYTKPLDLISLSVSLPPDVRLKQMMDVATRQLLHNGAMDQILRKYNETGADFLRPALPFER